MAAPLGGRLGGDQEMHLRRDIRRRRIGQAKPHLICDAGVSVENVSQSPRYSGWACEPDGGVVGAGPRQLIEE